MSKKLSEIDWSQVKIRSVYRSLPPDQRAQYKKEAELEDQDIEWVRAEQDRLDEEAMHQGCSPRRASSALRRLARRQSLSDEEMMARSGLDREAIASMSGRDATPSIETMEAYAKALGKKLLIVLADEDAG